MPMPPPTTDKYSQDNVPELLKVLNQFEEIFAVLKDDDAAKVRATVEWAKTEGHTQTKSVLWPQNLRKLLHCRTKMSKS